MPGQAQDLPHVPRASQELWKFGQAKDRRQDEALAQPGMSDPQHDECQCRQGEQDFHELLESFQVKTTARSALSVPVVAPYSARAATLSSSVATHASVHPRLRPCSSNTC